jgi:hypothetical protein
VTSQLSMLAAAALLSGLVGNLSAQDPVTTVTEGCATEIAQYCSQVSPGEGRLLACLNANSASVGICSDAGDRLVVAPPFGVASGIFMIVPRG